MKKIITLQKIALLFLTLTFIACGGGSSGGGSSTPTPNPDGNGDGGKNPDGNGGGVPEDNRTKIRISEATGDEGGMITFKVIANPPIAKQITFTFEATVDNTTTAGEADLSSELIGSGTIATNDSSTTISILTANDNLREHNETFLVILSDLSPTSDVTFTDYEAIGTILANDPAGIVVISVADAEASEASSEIIFQVTSAFPAATGSPFTFDYEATVDSPFKPNSSASTDDFTAIKNTATIPADSTNAMISITVAIDDTVETNETFSLRLTNLSENATIDNLIYEGTILNDDLGEISDATAIIGDGEITLNWTNPDSNLFAGVTIARIAGSTAPAENCSSGITNDIENATSDTIEDLTNGIAYSFRICAKSNAGSLSGGVKLESLIPEPTVDNNGNGLIEIATATELNNMRHNLDATSLKTSSTAAGFTKGCPESGCNGYELISDITLSGAWTPIGTFTKIFDGNNNRISGLRISTTDSNVGLFSILNNATIRNLKLADVSITGDGNVGALVGQATGTTTLSNIELIGDANQESSNAEIKGAGANVGGLVGDFRGTISDASSSLTVRGGATEDANNTGGLVGQLRSGSIQNSNSSGFVSASNGAFYVGGLVGVNNATINNSWASGNVSSSNGNDSDSYGGLVGLNNATISKSWASGNVSTSTGFYNNGYGGLVGINSGGTISKSWASGNVSSTVGFNFNYGGLVGQNDTGSTISNSWASGNVVGRSNNYGGLVGRMQVGSNIIQSWASGAVTGRPLGGLVGLNDRGDIQGRNYRLSSRIGTGVNENNSIELNTTTDLANLSGANGDTATADSNWHAGFNAVNTQANLLTRFCDTNGNGMIDGTPDGFLERTPDNTVWVMEGADPSNDLPDAPDINGDGTADFYAIPAIRCIGTTPAERKANIDLQRSKFPTN